MDSNNGIKIAFVISAVCHSFIFFGFPAFNVFLPKKTPKQQLQITYYQVRQLKSILNNKGYSRFSAGDISKGKVNLGVKRSVSNSKQVKKSQAVVSPVSPVRLEKTEKKQKQTESVKKAAKKIKPSVKKEIPQTPADVKKMPTYLDYVELVRRKIKSTAASKYRRPGLCGEIFLKFILYSDGKLAVAKVVDEQSCDNQKLKRIAREVMSKAAPFEAFPGDLNFKQLSFSVIISFE